MNLAVEMNDPDTLVSWALKAESPTLACEAESIEKQMQLAVDLSDFSGLTRWLKAADKLEALASIRTAASVTLSGASGKSAAKINQQFAATEERLNGAPVFVGVGDSLQCLCIAADGDWFVQSIKSKGSKTGYAYVKDKTSPLDPAAQWVVAATQVLRSACRVDSTCCCCDDRQCCRSSRLPVTSRL